MRSYLALLREHLVVRVVHEIVLQERVGKRAGSGYFHLAILAQCLNPDAASVATSSLITLNWVRLAIPNEVVIATSEASRPTAINTRPMRGWLCRASTVHQRLARYTSNHALKSIGVKVGGIPISPRDPFT